MASDAQDTLALLTDRLRIALRGRIAYGLLTGEDINEYNLKPLQMASLMEAIEAFDMAELDAAAGVDEVVAQVSELTTAPVDGFIREGMRQAAHLEMSRKLIDQVTGEITDELAALEDHEWTPYCERALEMALMDRR